MSADLKHSAVSRCMEKVSFHSNPKEVQCQRMLKLLYNFTHFICQQGYVQNPLSQDSKICELRTFRLQVGLRKSRGSRNQIANISWIIEKAKELQKNIYFCFIDYAKAFDCVDHSTLWNILKEMGIPDHLTCLLRNLSQEAAVRTEHGKMDSFKIGKGVYKGVYCHPAYLTSMQIFFFFFLQ